MPLPLPPGATPAAVLAAALALIAAPLSAPTHEAAVASATQSPDVVRSVPASVPAQLAADLEAPAPADEATQDPSAPAPPAPSVSGASVQELDADGVSSRAAAAPQALQRAVSAEHVDEAPAQAKLPAAAAKKVAVLTPIQSTKTFSAVGLTWKPTAGVSVTEASVRVREKGTWGEWTSLEVAETAGEGGRVGTQPLLADGDGVQARLITSTGAAPRDVKITAVDGGNAPAPRAQATTAKTAAYRPNTVGGDALKPAKIVTRAQWGANEKLADTTPSRSVKLRAMYVHHTTGSNTYTAAQSAKIVRSYFQYHINGNDWDDIGYHFLIDRFGTIYEGRRGAMNDLVVGAQAGGFNTSSIGIALIGNYETAKPSAAMLASLRQVLAWKGYANNIDVTGKTVLTATVSGASTSRHRDGARVSVPTLMGHRDTNLTACPGRHVYAALPQLRKDVAALIASAKTTHGVAGSPLKAPVANAKYNNNTKLVPSGMVSLRWKKVSYAAKYQIMERVVGQKDAFSRNGFWSAAAITTGTSKSIRVKPGVTQVFGVRAIDAQGRPGPVTRLVQLTRPVSSASSAVKATKAKLGPKHSGATNGRGWVLSAKGSALAARSVVGADRVGITYQAPKGATIVIKQGKKTVKTIKTKASKSYKTLYAALPSRSRQDVTVTVTALPKKATATVLNLGFLRPRFAPEASVYTAAGAGQPVLRVPNAVSVSKGSATTLESAVDFTWAPRKDAVNYTVQVQRTPRGGKTGAWRAVTVSTATQLRVKVALGEKVRVRVAATSVFGRGSSYGYSLNVTRVSPPVVAPSPAPKPTPSPSPSPAQPGPTTAPATGAAVPAVREGDGAQLDA